MFSLSTVHLENFLYHLHLRQSYGEGYHLPHTASTAAAKRVNETVKTRSSTQGYKAAPTFPLGRHGLPFALVGSVPQAGGHVLAANCLRPCTGTSTSWCCLCWLPLVLGQLLLQGQELSWVILLKTVSEGNISMFAQIYGEVKLFSSSSIFLLNIQFNKKYWF